MQPTSGALRASNRAHVVRVLRHAGWATRAELVSYTGLSRATVSSVLGELNERGLIAERTMPGGTGRGRPAARVGLDRTAGTAIAVDIGVRHVAVAIGDLAHSVLAEHWVTMPPRHSAASGMRTVLASIEDAVQQAGVSADELVGAAISIAAPVAGPDGELIVSRVLPGWDQSSLAEQVASRWRIPVVTENDANLGALGEAVAHPPAGDGDVVYVKIASRIGMGIVRDRRIVRGRNGFAGELGHTPAQHDNQQCWCGRRGCLELYAGGDGMLRRLADEPSGAAASSIADLVDAATSSTTARRVVADGVSLLARALAGVAVTLDPARIVLGGELCALGDLLEGPIRRELDNLPFGPPPELSMSPLGRRASLVGALSLVLTEPARFVDHAQNAPPPNRAAASHRYPQSPLATTELLGVQP